MQPEIKLIDYTGAGSKDPARRAANLLVFTKQTRLEMKPSLMEEIIDWTDEMIIEQLTYMANTIPSSWEFVHYTFLIEGVSRGFTHQFVRTRTASFAQQTMRVLNVNGWTYGTGPTIEGDDKLETIYDRGMAKIADVYDDLIAGGAKIEDARGILPTNIQTNIVASFNLRTLTEVARKRASSRTQSEYRTVLDGMIDEVKRVHPWTALFFERTFDVAAADLEAQINGIGLCDESERIAMLKMIDQMRATV